MRLTIFENLDSVFEMTGLWLNPARKGWRKLLEYRAYLFTLVEILQIVSIFLFGIDKRSLMETGFFTVVGIITSCQILHFHWNQNQIEKLLHRIHKFQTSHHEEWEFDVFEGETKIAWKVVHAYWWIVVSYAGVYLAVPVFVDFIFGNIFESFPNVRVAVPLQGILNFLEQRSIQNFILSLLGVFWSFYGILIHIGVECSLYLTIIYMKIEMKIISKKIAIMKTSMRRNKSVDYRLSLKDLAKHHKQILRMLQDMIVMYGQPIAVQNTVVSSCFCLNMFSVTSMEDQGDLVLAVQNTYALACLLGVIFFVCNLGESLDTENGYIFCQLYDLPWDEQGPGFRRDLMMIMRQFMKPFIIHYHYKSPLIARTFMEIINTSYSYFMMLKSTM